MIVCQHEWQNYKNPGNGYTVAVYRTREREKIPAPAIKADQGKWVSFTAVGMELPDLEHVDIELEGTWEDKERFGKQLKVESFHVLLPKTRQGISSYLSSMVKGIGPVLAETMADAENFTLISGDVLQLDIPRLVDGHFQGLTPLVCANLPYNAATPILGALVEAKRFEAITVMVQREAALRLAAKPGTGDYGALSVYMQYHTQPEILFDVPPECFLPAPKVTSSVIRCQVRGEPAVRPACGEEFFFRTVKGAFALRRKTLCNSLCTAFGSQLGKGGIAEVISQCGLPPAVRGEALGLEEFAVLADGLYEMIQRL